MSEVEEWEEASDKIYMAVDTDYNYIAVSSQTESMEQTWENKNRTERKGWEADGGRKRVTLQ